MLDVTWMLHESAHDVKPEDNQIIRQRFSKKRNSFIGLASGKKNFNSESSIIIENVRFAYVQETLWRNSQNNYYEIITRKWLDWFYDTEGKLIGSVVIFRELTEKGWRLSCWLVFSLFPYYHKYSTFRLHLCEFWFSGWVWLCGCPHDKMTAMFSRLYSCFRILDWPLWNWLAECLGRLQLVQVFWAQGFAVLQPGSGHCNEDNKLNNDKDQIKLLPTQQ